ncbi:hypothetical protein X975_00543, partial [Stegodyphus mimosarum]
MYRKQQVLVINFITYSCTRHAHSNIVCTRRAHIFLMPESRLMDFVTRVVMAKPLS